MQSIEPSASFPVFIVEKIKEAKEYYIANFGFSPMFESNWYIHLVSPSGIQLGSLIPGHSSQPPLFQTRFGGDGAILSFEGQDVDSVYDLAQGRGMDVILPIKTEDWGQRHFAVQDPNGIRIDIVQTTEATEEYEEKYV